MPYVVWEPVSLIQETEIHTSLEMDVFKAARSFTLHLLYPFSSF